MKKVLLLLLSFLSIISFPQRQDRFIIGAEHVSAMVRFWGDEPVPLSDAYWDKVKEFGLNWAGLKYFEKYYGANPTIGRIDKSEIPCYYTMNLIEKIIAILMYPDGGLIS